ncbi:MAG: 2-oxo acid dehydrogenase [Myxococcales bacterium]|nr:2-oxo acid dehydrogenase [Myxococcales bacterium]|tara:strand:- start:394 stop:1212 length:819 start_codon:yes stop_codon:yes gene_type:complete
MTRHTNSTRRKLAIATWAAPREGLIYGSLSIDTTEAQRYIDYLRDESGLRVSITHLVGKALALGLKASPGLNGRIHRGRFIPFEEVAFAFLVALEDGGDLAKVKVERAEEKTVVEITKQLDAEAQRLRAGKDDQFNKSKGLLRLLPTWILRPIIHLTGKIASGYGWNIPALGIEAFPFGSAVLTSVGMFGIEVGYAPPTPWAHVPVYAAICAIRDEPVAVDGQVVIRPMLTLTATLDHRFIDGMDAAKFAKTIRRVLEKPWELDGLEQAPYG